jgi:hypothetical protein
MHFKAFEQTYDKIFAEFQTKLLQEYRQMKESYIQEFQNNYQVN